jgi:hypothetical protein
VNSHFAVTHSLRVTGFVAPSYRVVAVATASHEMAEEDGNGGGAAAADGNDDEDVGPSLGLAANVDRAPNSAREVNWRLAAVAEALCVRVAGADCRQIATDIAVTA